MSKKRSSRRGFTLLEVLLVIVILVTLAALVLPNFAGVGDKAKKDAAALQIKGLEDALEIFKNHIGRYPTTEEGLKALNDKDQIQDEDLVKKWSGPYAGKGETTDFDVKDPWNNEFRYTAPGTHNTKSFDLYSAGPDGQEETEDDIGNWAKEK
jgi:general secretion pathway protein G